MKGITYDRLVKEGWAPLNIPEPWVPFAKGNFPTPSKKCEFYSEQLGKIGNLRSMFRRASTARTSADATDVEGCEALPEFEPRRCARQREGRGRTAASNAQG
jgi:hypothetical protein